MSTRSDIIVEHNDGTWKRIYCHFDGYPDHHGPILTEHYSSQELAEALVAPGDMSSLDDKCDRPDGHSYERPVAGYCVYYRRDRGEMEAVGFVAATLDEAWPPKETWTEFVYVWSKEAGAWFIGDPDGDKTSLKPLALVMADGDEAPKTAIKTPWGVIGKRA